MQNYIFDGLKYVFILVACSFISLNTANCEELTDLKDKVVYRLNLINKIINDPKAANMKNWIVLGNPHDESELNFYMNSISNGTLSAYDKKEKTMLKLVEHSYSKSEDEPSILLQHLRLSLMAHNIRPGSNPPSFQFVKLKQSDKSEIIARCNFHFINAAGVQEDKKSEVFFDIGDNPANDIFLQKIIINGRIAYGPQY